VEEIFVPALGMAMEEATLTEWIKAPGDRVEVGDPVAEIETDKSTLELAATTAGTLGRHRAEPGQVIAVGTTVVVVLGEGESESRPDAPPEASGLPSTPDAEDPGTETVESPAVKATAEEVSDVGPRHKLSPRQRRLAAQTAEPATTPVRNGTTRDSIARAVSRSWAEIPHFAVAREVDADGVLDRLASDQKIGAVRVSVTDVLVRALARSIAGRGLAPDIGLAVATKDGVALPVLPDVLGRTLPEIAELRQAAVERARDHRSTEADARKPALTLSNLGTHGATWFTGIIPLGQQGLLTTGTIEQRPVVRNGHLSVGWRINAILNVDHRIWDGAEAAETLAAFAQDLTAYGAYDDEH